MSTPAPTSAVLCGPWATPGDVPDKVKTETGITDDVQWLRPLELASELLWMLTGRRWLGVGCTETVTLRSTGATQGRGSWPYSRTWGQCPCWGFGGWSGGWLWPPTSYAGAHIARPFAVKLPRSEASAVTSVTIGGVAFTDFELTHDGWLRRTDGQGWPVCGDETVITYQFGTPPPAGGVAACVALGTELAKDMYNLDDCQLPARTTSISREGITMTVIDPQTFLDKGRTGLVSVDIWLSAINPTSRTQRAMIWSPDLPVAQR
jgi:hypothetical protein